MTEYSKSAKRIVRKENCSLQAISFTDKIFKRFGLQTDVKRVTKTMREKKTMVVYEAFSLFVLMFSTLPKTNFNFSVTFIVLSANTFNLDQSKILLFGKGLNLKAEEV